ncbi:MAG: hypothetical protein ACK56I_29605, partial [bacterium]
LESSMAADDPSRECSGDLGTQVNARVLACGALGLVFHGGLGRRHHTDDVHFGRSETTFGFDQIREFRQN